jgi:hypothetical protein
MPQDYKLLINWFGIDGPTYEDSRAMLEAAMENRSSQELRVFAQILLEKAENKNA